VPRITDERRAANRAVIVDAARRCFARDGFHQTSMPDIVAEAGISAGAFYRYFAGKDELIQELAREAFAGIVAEIVRALDALVAPSAADVIGVLVENLGAETFTVDGREIDLDIQARVIVQAWGELLRDDTLRATALRGLAGFHAGIAAALARGQRSGRVAPALDPTDGGQLIVSLLPGLILQRTVLGLHPAAVGRAAAAMLDG
jgi:AcrR family transcriptional regulator